MIWIKQAVGRCFGSSRCRLLPNHFFLPHVLGATAIAEYFRFVFRPGSLQNLSYMGTFVPGRWAVSHAGNEFVLNEVLPTKSSS